MFGLVKTASPYPFELFLTLIITTFTLCLSQAHDPVFLQKTLPIFLLVLGSTLQILNSVKQLDREFSSGCLALFLSCGVSPQRFILKKLWGKITYESLPLSMFIALILQAYGYEFTISFTVFFIVSIFTQSLSLILATLRIQHRISSVFGVFLLWPFLIPVFLMSLFILGTDINSQETMMNMLFGDMIFMMIALSLVMLGIVLLLTPHLLRLTFEG